MDTPNFRIYPLTVDEWHESRKTLQECDDTLFGNWNTETHKRMPGILEQMNFITFVMKLLVPLMIVSVLKDLGVPTQVVIPLVLKLVGISLGG